MNIELREECIVTALPEYGQVSIAFLVESVLDISFLHNGLGGITLTERALTTPYTKDYDAIKGEGPTRWAKRFDVSNWGLISAYAGDRRVGGVVVAFDTKDVHMLEDRRDLAVVWDLRVSPEHRGRGIGSALFKAAEDWATARACKHLKVETQNINVVACKFYASQGCVLGSFNRFAYTEFPDEIQLLWYKKL